MRGSLDGVSGRLRRWTALVALAAAVGAARPAAAADDERPRRILLLHSYGRDYGPYHVVAEELHARLSQVRSPAIDIYDSSLDMARWGEDESAFVQFLQSRFAERRLDLVVSIGAAAAQFALRQRPRLLDTTPLLAAALDERFLQLTPLTPLDGAIPTRIEVLGHVKLMLELFPQTKEICFVIGSSPHEHRWRGEVQRELEPLSAVVKLTLWNELSVGEMAAAARKLGPGSIIVYGMLVIDGHGVPQERDRAFVQIHEASAVPVTTLMAGQIGVGSLGGLVVDERQLARDTTTAIQRILAGAPAASVRPPTNMARPIFDWRELKRFKVPLDRLPAGSEIRFRPPPPWKEYPNVSMAALAALILQGALIVGLVAQRARRRDAEDRARLLSRRLITAHEDERRHLARELHDDLTQRLARASIDVARIERELTDGESRALAHALRLEIAKLGDDVHTLSYRLHPAVLEDLGLQEALRSEADRFAGAAGLEVAINAFEVPKELPDDVALCLFRVAQEALRNVDRHAQARAVEVSLTGRPGAVELEVRDDGIGIDGGASREGPKLGIASMRERVGALGGRLHVDSSPGRGTVIRARVPLAGVVPDRSARPDDGAAA